MLNLHNIINKAHQFCSLIKFFKSYLMKNQDPDIIYRDPGY